jgi:hypothetical protein
MFLLRITHPCRMVMLAMLLSAAAGCGSAPRESPRADSPKTGAASKTPDAVLTPKELRDEFQKDSKAFLKKYENKLLEVTGKVIDFGYEFGGEVYLQLEGPGILKVHCKEPEPWSKALPGQTVTLRGNCDPDWGVRLWEIVKVSGDPPPTFAAEELMKELSSDEAGTNKKIAGKFLIFTGKITKIENEGGKIYLTNPEKEPAIRCFMGSNSKVETARNKAFQVGQHVKLLGQSLTGGPELASCVLISSP